MRMTLLRNAFYVVAMTIALVPAANASSVRTFVSATGHVLTRQQREHYEHHDIPAELITAWSAERKAARRRRRTAKGAPPEEAVVAE